MQLEFLKSQLQFLFTLLVNNKFSLFYFYFLKKVHYTKYYGLLQVQLDFFTSEALGRRFLIGYTPGIQAARLFSASKIQTKNAKSNPRLK